MKIIEVMNKAVRGLYYKLQCLMPVAVGGDLSGKPTAAPAFLILLMLLLPLTACAAQGTAEKSQGGSSVPVYYLVKEAYGTGGELIRGESILIPENADVLEYLIEAVTREPQSEELAPFMPPGISVEDFTLNEDGELILSMSSGYSELDGIDKTVADYCLVLTLCAADSVELVSIYVDDQLVSSGLAPDDAALYDDSGMPEKRVKLYFPHVDGSFLGYEYRYIETNEDISTERQVVDLLISGAESDSLLSPLTKEIELRSISLSAGEDGICIVNLSSEFLDFIPDTLTEQRLTVYSIVNSLCSIPGINRVRFLVDGRIIQHYGYIPLSEALEWNAQIAEVPRAAKAERMVTVYLANPETGLLGGIPVKAAAGESEELSAVYALIYALPEAGFINLFSAEYTPTAIMTKSGVCELDLPAGFFAQDAASLYLALDALTATLTDIPDINAVMLRMEGQPPIIGDIDLSGIHIRNDEIIIS